MITSVELAHELVNLPFFTSFERTKPRERFCNLPLPFRRRPKVIPDCKLSFQFTASDQEIQVPLNERAVGVKCHGANVKFNLRGVCVNGNQDAIILVFTCQQASERSYKGGREEVYADLNTPGVISPPFIVNNRPQAFRRIKKAFYFLANPGRES